MHVHWYKQRQPMFTFCWIGYWHMHQYLNREFVVTTCLLNICWYTHQLLNGDPGGLLWLYWYADSPLFCVNADWRHLTLKCHVGTFLFILSFTNGSEIQWVGFAALGMMLWSKIGDTSSHSISGIRYMNAVVYAEWRFSVWLGFTQIRPLQSSTVWQLIWHFVLHCLWHYI